jgi:hypothetical protein
MVAIGSGLAFPSGELSPENALSDLVSLTLPMRIDFGYALLPSVEIGTHASVGVGLPGEKANRAESIFALTFGVHANVRRPTETGALWGGAVVGVSRLSFGQQIEEESASVSVSGTQFGLQGGFDFRVPSQEDVSVGPYASFLFGSYNNYSIERTDEEDSTSGTFTDTSMHQMLTVGVRGRFEL